MFTLSDASKDTKQILKWGGIILLTIIALLILFRLTIFIKELIFPTPPPSPEVAFGKLNPQIFPQNVSDQEFTYSIDTVTGSLPGLGDQVKVYEIKQPPPDLLALDKTEQIITGGGFAGKEAKITDRIYEWSNNPFIAGIPRKIRMNILTHSFTIDSHYMSNEEVLSGKNMPDETKAKIVAEGVLQDMNLFPTDVDEDKTKTHLFSIKNDSLVDATSLSNAQVIEVNFYQKDVFKLPIFYENPVSSNMSMLVASGGQIVGANFNYQEVSEISSTYPIKTSPEAYRELSEGKAYIGSYFGQSSNVSITNVFLAYYIGNQQQDYLMPIIVFQGSDGFFAYVPAIKDEWINK